MPFKKPQLGLDLDHHTEPDSAKSSRPPEAYRDPSEHILSGKGSTLQHARSVYSQGPVEILPGLFLGDEHNACDNQMLSNLGITTILNVSKETVLPFQLAQPAPSTTLAPEWGGTPRRPGSAARSISLLSAVQQEPVSLEPYFTPPTSVAPDQLTHNIAPLPTSLLRNTLSTPNLLAHFHDNDAVQSGTTEQAEDTRLYTAQDVSRYRSLRRESSSSSDDAFGSPCSSRAASTCTSATTDLSPPVAQPHHVNAETVFENKPQDDITRVDLPSNAITLRIPASPRSSRAKELRYIKLPWTHDETDLSSPDGGFTQGCALIAEVLGLDQRVWVAAKIADQTSTPLLPHRNNLAQIQTGDTGGKILVHCQCGVSRSATLVIAFVMQAAALRFGFPETESLMGMHDCYNMVKDKSASISPNISLIYQLVEWERHLSSAARRLRDVESRGSTASRHEDEDDGDYSSTGAGWSTETMDEAMWSKMRLQEEEKEAAEEARRREERRTEAARPSGTGPQFSGEVASSVEQGEEDSTGSGSSSLLQRRRKKAAPALQLQTTTSTAQIAGSDTLSKRKPAHLTLDSTSAAETPFHTAHMHQPHGNNLDVDMQDVEPPCTPLPRPDSDLLDPACTPTAAKSSTDGEALRTPSVPQFPHRLGSLSATFHPTTLLASSSQLDRFSFGSGNTIPARPASSGTKGSIGPSALFGVSALSHEERRKQHRRTFSSDWPALQAAAAANAVIAPGPPRRGSKLADSIDLLSHDTAAPMDHDDD